MRINEGIDSGHGRRGAELARDLHSVAYDLADEDFDLLIQGCDFHTEGYLDGDVTLRTCWDADRLDYGIADGFATGKNADDLLLPFFLGVLPEGKYADYKVKFEVKV